MCLTTRKYGITRVVGCIDHKKNEACPLLLVFEDLKPNAFYEYSIIMLSNCMVCVFRYMYMCTVYINVYMYVQIMHSM